ncbi:MAG: hypothetical protein ACXABY_15305, partial [Candidatus Thorarchaeota archaeon]
TYIGGVATTNNWNAAGAIAAGDVDTVQVDYTAAGAELFVDGVSMVAVVAAVDLGGAPVAVYWGSDQNEANQYDAVFSAPTP